jgi:hypothetical protein
LNQLLGEPDDLKLISSLELFSATSTNSIAAATEVFHREAKQILVVAQAAGYAKCERTRQFIEQHVGEADHL